jgi:hypothetical protein
MTERLLAQIRPRRGYASVEFKREGIWTRDAALLRVWCVLANHSVGFIPGDNSLTVTSPKVANEGATYQREKFTSHFGPATS